MGLTVAELEQEIVSQGAAQSGLLAEVADARGTTRTLGARLSVALNPDGTLRSSAATVSFVTEIAPIISYPPTGAYVALEGDLTAVYVAKRRLRINGALLPYVTSSTYDVGGDYTVVNFSTPVGNSITSVEYSFDPAAMPPLHYSGNPDIEQVVSGISTFATKHLSDAQYKSLLDDILSRVTITSLASVDDGAGVDLVGRAFKYVDIIDDLRTLTPTDAPVYIQGHTIIDDGGQGTFRWDTSSTSADDNGVTIAVTGVATGRWVRQLNGFVTLEMFGGGIGVADNSVAFQSAYDTGYRNFKFGPGTYTFTTGLTFTSPVNISGVGHRGIDHPEYGTTLYYTGSNDFITFDLPVTRRGGKISDIKIQATDTAITILTLNNCWRFAVVDCEFFGGGRSIQANDLTFAVMLNRCRVQSYNIAGLDTEATTTDIKVLECDFAGEVNSTAWAIINRGVGMDISKSWFEYGSGARPSNPGGHIRVPSDAANNCTTTIVENQLGRTGETNSGHQILLEGGLGHTIANNTFSASNVPASNCIYVDMPTSFLGLNPVVILGNRFTNFINEAIYISEGFVNINSNTFFTQSAIFTADVYIYDVYNTNSRISVNENTFSYSATSDKHAVLGAGVTETPQITSFSNNTIYNMGGADGYVSVANGNDINGGSGKTATGISVRGGVVSGNKIRNCATGIKARDCTVEANYFTTNTVNIEPYTADGINPLIGRNSGDTQTVTTSGATLNRYGITYVDTTAGALTGTLGNGYRPGDIKLFSVSVYNGNYTLTVTNHEGSGSKVFVLGSVNASVTLMWDGATWVTLRDGSAL